MPSVATSATATRRLLEQCVVIHACRATVRCAASKPTRAGRERCQTLHQRHVVRAVDRRQLERGKFALQSLDLGDYREVGQALETIGGEDDNRRTAGEVGQVENVRQRRDDERVEMLFGERGANRLMTAFKRFGGRVRHGWRRATLRAPRQSVSRDRQGSGPAYHRRGLAWRRPVGSAGQRQPQRSRRACQW